MLWKLHQYNWFCVYLLFLFSTSSSKRRASLGHRIAWKIGILDSHTVLLLWGTVGVAEKAEAESIQVWGSGAEPAETWQKTQGFIQCWLAEVCWAGEGKILGQVASGATGLCYTVCLLCNHGSTTACAVLLAGQPFLLLLGNESSDLITFHEDRLAGRRTALFLHNTALRKSKKDKEVVTVKWASVATCGSFPMKHNSCCLQILALGGCPESSTWPHVAEPWCQPAEIFQNLAWHQPLLAVQDRDYACVYGNSVSMWEDCRADGFTVLCGYSDHRFTWKVCRSKQEVGLEQMHWKHGLKIITWATIADQTGKK